MRRIVLGMALAAGFVNAHADDDGFTAADVLGWDQKSQNSYFETSISMAGVLASQSKNPAVHCIDDWYFGSAGHKSRVNDEIRATMQQYPDYYPATVIVAVIERECGSLTISK